MSIKNSVENARRNELKKYEKDIAAGARAFVQVGVALGMIRLNGLYALAGYKTFDEYVEDRHDISRRSADRLIGAARVVGLLGPMGLKITNERMARELAVFGRDKDKMTAVVTAAEARTGKLTAALIETVRVELYPETKVIEGEVVEDRPAIEGRKPECEACGAALDEGIVKSAQTRCLSCDPEREHFALNAGGPCDTCGQTAAHALAEELPEDSGNVSTPPSDVPGQAAADTDTASADGSPVPEPAGKAGGEPAGQGLTVEVLPGKPQDSPADSDSDDQRDEVALVASQPGPSSPLARGEAGQLAGPVVVEDGPPSGPSSTLQDITDGQTPPPSMGSVLSPAAVPGVAAAGDEVGEESEAGPLDSFPADPASEWMDGWRALIGAASSLRSEFSETELGEIRDDIVTLGRIFRHA